MDKPDVSKLPKKVQYYIHKLETEIEGLKNDRDILANDETHVFFATRIDERIRIPDEATVSFLLKSGRIDLHRERNGNVLEVYSLPHPVMILPSAANHFHVKVED